MKTTDVVTEQTYTFEGVDCANCALKIEKGVQSLEGIKTASMNFGNGLLHVEADPDRNQTELLTQMQSVFQRIEPGSVVRERKVSNSDVARRAEEPIPFDHPDNPPEDELKLMQVRFLPDALGILLFLAALLLPLMLPVVSWVSVLRVVLYLAAWVLLGRNVLRLAWLGLVRGQPFNENFLMSIATIGAIAIGEYPEGVAVMLFYRIGETFQDMAVERSRKAIRDLMDIRPDTVHVKTGSGLAVVPAVTFQKGDTFTVIPGERLALDGIVIMGSGTLDTSALTGESVPREVAVGDVVLSGSVNGASMLEVQSTSVYAETTVSRMLELMEKAGAKKAKTEHFISKFAAIYTPVVVGFATLLALLPPILGFGTFQEWIYRALVFLVISCPCALVVSIPLGFFGGIGGASRHGILIKGGQYLEALRKPHTIVFDKTGTLTKGKFVLQDIEAADEFTKTDLLTWAAHVESLSSHPIAKSIVRAAPSAPDMHRVSEFKEVTGGGVQAVVDGMQVLAGKHTFLAGASISGLPTKVSSSGLVTVYVSVAGRYAGCLHLADEVKIDSAMTTQRLKRLGVSRVVMLTGDTQAVADRIGQMVGMDEWHAGLLPDGKVEQLERLMSETPKGRKLLFVGDGINDAPALMRADVGIAMGAAGSDIAISSADVVLMGDEPAKVADAIAIARRTGQIVNQNIYLTMGIKIAVLILGAGGLATMWEAVFADVGVALLAVLNAMRVLKNPLGKTSGN